MPAVLPAEEVHLGLRLPFPDVADSPPVAESLSGADHGAVRPVCFDMADAIPEDRLGLRVQKAEAAGKLAALEPRPADAVLDRPGLAWVLCPELPAWGAPVERLAQPHAAVALYTPDAGPSAA